MQIRNILLVTPFLSAVLLHWTCTRDEAPLQPEYNLVITPFNPQRTFSFDPALGDTGWFNIDMDDNGTIDIQINSWRGYHMCNNINYAQHFLTITSTDTSGLLDIRSNENWVPLSPSGTDLGNPAYNSGYWGDQVYLELACCMPLTPPCFGSGVSTYPGSGYIGLRLNKNNQYYYGWLRVSYIHKAITLLEKAISTIPNTPVVLP